MIEASNIKGYVDMLCEEIFKHVGIIVILCATGEEEKKLCIDS